MYGTARWCTPWKRRSSIPIWACRRPSRRRHTRCLSDWSSDVCSSDLTSELQSLRHLVCRLLLAVFETHRVVGLTPATPNVDVDLLAQRQPLRLGNPDLRIERTRSEEHTSEL